MPKWKVSSTTSLYALALVGGGTITATMLLVVERANGNSFQHFTNEVNKPNAFGLLKEPSKPTK